VDQGKHTAENALEILNGPLESRRIESVLAAFCGTLRTHDARAAEDFTERLAAHTRTHSQV
jgi:hypothetical protein